jgi:hypothetical protein
MKLVFQCPDTRQVFTSGQFEIVEYKGVRIGPGGEKVLDARVALAEPCPYCGKRHQFDTCELSCPVDWNDRGKIEKGGIRP